MFTFKQFTIHQDQCSMKVTEMACLFGAWVHVPSSAKRILDIGFGTGLLSLMLAQRYPSIQIDAIEIDPDSFHQGRDNINNSTFHPQIKTYLEDIRSYATDKPYDFIIVNPPFFENQLISPDSKKNSAWHSKNLSLAELFDCIKKLLSPQGCFSILIPVNRRQDFEALNRKYNFHSSHIVLVKHTALHTPKIMMAQVSTIKKECNVEEVCLKQNQQYTPYIKDLFSPYYLS